MGINEHNNGKWICTFCGEENDDSDLKCKSCGEPRIDIKQNTIKKVKEEKSEENKWICPMCGGKNNLSSSRCVYCGYENPSFKKKERSIKEINQKIKEHLNECEIEKASGLIKQAITNNIDESLLKVTREDINKINDLVNNTEYLAKNSTPNKLKIIENLILLKESFGFCKNDIEEILNIINSYENFSPEETLEKIKIVNELMKINIFPNTLFWLFNKLIERLQYFLNNESISDLKEFKNSLVKLYEVISTDFKDKILDILNQIKKIENTKLWYKPSNWFYISIYLTMGLFLWAQGIYLNKYDKSPYLSFLNFLNGTLFFFLLSISECFKEGTYIYDTLFNYSMISWLITISLYIIYFVKRKPKSERIKYNSKYLTSAIITFFIIFFVGGFLSIIFAPSFFKLFNLQCIIKP